MEDGSTHLIEERCPSSAERVSAVEGGVHSTREENRLESACEEVVVDKPARRVGEGRLIRSSINISKQVREVSDQVQLRILIARDRYN